MGGRTMKAMSLKAQRQKQLNITIKAINQTAGRAVHLFIICLMEVLKDKMTQSELIDAYDLWCNRMPEELETDRDDDVADDVIDHRLRQIVNDKLIPKEKQKLLLKKIYKLLKDE